MKSTRDILGALYMSTPKERPTCDSAYTGLTRQGYDDNEDKITSVESGNFQLALGEYATAHSDAPLGGGKMSRGGVNPPLVFL